MAEPCVVRNGCGAMSTLHAEDAGSFPYWLVPILLRNLCYVKQVRSLAGRPGPGAHGTRTGLPPLPPSWDATPVPRLRRNGPGLARRDLPHRNERDRNERG